jgi:dolichyl-phosphate-mannose--protein O-mannosyl transferase
VSFTYCLYVFCSYGPREVKFRDEFSLLGQLNCELKYATFSGKLRRQHQQDSEEKEASLIIREALEPAVRLVSRYLQTLFSLLLVLLVFVTFKSRRIGFKVVTATIWRIPDLA